MGIALPSSYLRYEIGGKSQMKIRQFRKQSFSTESVKADIRPAIPKIAFRRIRYKL